MLCDEHDELGYEAFIGEQFRQQEIAEQNRDVARRYAGGSLDADLLWWDHVEMMAEQGLAPDGEPLIDDLVDDPMEEGHGDV